MGETYYEVLGLSFDANDSQIGQAYRKRKAESQRNADRLRRIEAAYRTLANPISRRNYLKALRAGELEPQAGENSRNDAPIPPLSGRAGAESHERDSGADLPERRAGPNAGSPAARSRPARQPTELIDSSGAVFVEPRHETAPDVAAKSGIENGESSDDATRIARVQPGSDAPATERPVRLHVVYQGKTDVYELRSGMNWIGRPSVNTQAPAVPLADPESFISRQHARVFVEGSMCTITDTSDNGTQLNGKWLPKGQPHRLKDGDVIAIEGRELTIRFN